MASSDVQTLTMLALRLKGTADVDAVADYYGLDPADVQTAVEEAWGGGFAEQRSGRFPGIRLTASGRKEAERLLAEELDRTGTRHEIESVYDEFLGVNSSLLEICTAWQLRRVDGITEPNDHTDAAYDAGVIDRLVEVHARIDPLLDRLEAALDRFGGHRTRLASALDHLRGGDHDYFTKPMFPSYHSVWFELHEDLLATLGRARADETSA